MRAYLDWVSRIVLLLLSRLTSTPRYGPQAPSVDHLPGRFEIRSNPVDPLGRACYKQVVNLDQDHIESDLLSKSAADVHASVGFKPIDRPQAPVEGSVPAPRGLLDPVAPT